MRRFVLFIILLGLAVPNLMAQDDYARRRTAEDACIDLLRKPSLDKAQFNKWINELEKYDSERAETFKKEVKAIDKHKAGKRLSSEDKYYLADAFQYGHLGIPRNLDVAVTLLEESTTGFREGREDVAMAMGWIGFDYVREFSDYERAYNLGRKAIAIGQKYGDAEEIGLGKYFYTEWPGADMCGHGRQLEAKGKLKDAFCCYYVGASYGSGSAAAELARCYADGIGVNRDIDMAYTLMVTAVTLGYDDVERRSDEYARRINQRNAAIYAERQRQAEERYKRENTSSVVGAVVAGAIVVGIGALIGKAFSSAASSSGSSYSSSSSSSSYSSSGTVSLCPDCSGRGMMNCVWCHGTGIIKGGWFESDDVCFSCKGAGQVWCWHCNGKGSR